MGESFQDKFGRIVRPIALTVLFPLLGFMICLWIKMFFAVETSRLIRSLVNFPIAALGAFVVFPLVLGVPFGKIGIRDFNRRIGLYVPKGVWKHVLLGVLLALCTLSGMLAASLLSGQYVLNLGTITLSHSIFALNPGVWEEVFYRGIQMAILIGLTRSVRKAAVIQVILFGLLHIKGFDAAALIDSVSVMIITIGFTYTAYKTGTLIAGIVFHYLHDALLFFVQIPQEIEWSAFDTVLFYACLWPMVGVGCLLTKWAAERWNVRAADELYSLEKINQST